MNEVENAEGKEMILAGERMWVEAQWAGDMQDAIRRVRELHKPVKSYKGRDHTEIVGCYECEETGSGREYWVEYPCPTIKALDGEQ